MVLVVKTAPAIQESKEMQVQSLGQEDPPGGGNANPLHYSGLENPVDKEDCRLQSVGS